MRSYRYPELRVWVDDAEEPIPAKLVIVVNLNAYALGIQPAREACDNDGLLDLRLFERGSAFQMIRYFYKVVRGTHEKLEDVRSLRAARIRVESDVPAVPFGSARIRREGSQVTLVTWGNGMEISLAAAKEVAEIASVEVIDLRSIQPWDRHTVQQSLAKTGRLVVVQEDAVSCSVGQMLISELTGDPDSWYSFVSPPQLVSRPDVHVGFNPIYEYAAVPSVADVVHAVELVMEE
ncbi:MAG: hypothetical protein IID45_02540 [Planctomycetes bacterium]|nr:hypothetical protein [Planctomycetota bacterium]